MGASVPPATQPKLPLPVDPMKSWKKMWLSWKYEILFRSSRLCILQFKASLLVKSASLHFCDIAAKLMYCTRKSWRCVIFFVLENRNFFVGPVAMRKRCGFITCGTAVYCLSVLCSEKRSTFILWSPIRPLIRWVFLVLQHTEYSSLCYWFISCPFLWDPFRGR